MLRTVLVPLDGSSFGEHALPHALSLARRTGATVHLVHVYESLFDGVEGYGPLDQQGVEDAKKYLAGLVQKLAGMGGLNISCKLLQGSVSRSLHDYAQQVQADLLVMTTHGRGRMARFWLGSVADRVVRRMPVPVLLIRPNEGPPALHQDMLFKQILIPLDGSAFAEQVLTPVAQLARAEQSAFTFLQVIPPTVLSAPEPMTAAVSGLDPVLVQQLEALQAQKRKQVEAYLQRLAQQWGNLAGQVETRLVEHLQPAAAILEVAQAGGMDLIAMATHGRGGFSRLFLGSTADKVVRGSELPMFLYHPPGETGAA